MAIYIWREPDDPEAENQNIFVNEYILKHFEPTSEDWENGVSAALCAYWREQGYESDPEEDTFILPVDVILQKQYECSQCKSQYSSEHDGDIYYDQDTNIPQFVCHDCLIMAARHRRWLLKEHMKLKMQSLAKKVQESP